MPVKRRTCHGIFLCSMIFIWFTATGADLDDDGNSDSGVNSNVDSNTNGITEQQIATHAHKKNWLSPSISMLLIAIGSMILALALVFMLLQLITKSRPITIGPARANESNVDSVSVADEAHVHQRTIDTSIYVNADETTPLTLYQSFPLLVDE